MSVALDVASASDVLSSIIHDLSRLGRTGSREKLLGTVSIVRSVVAEAREAPPIGLSTADIKGPAERNGNCLGIETAINAKLPSSEIERARLSFERADLFN